MKKGFLRFVGVVLYVVVLLISIEVVCQIAYRVTANKWLILAEDEPHHYLFEKHPYLVGVPKANATFKAKDGMSFTHNSMGLRGGEISQVKKTGMIRIAALGGSSTYCIGVSDDQAWPYYLEQDLGPSYEVINMGVPGYTTTENLIQSVFWLSEFSVDKCIYYEGWNDMRNMHVKGLKADYSSFHGRSQHTNLVLYLFKFGNRSAALRFFRKIFNQVMVKDPDGKYRIDGTADKLTARIDERAIKIYSRNLRLIIAVCRAQGIQPIMVPQVINSQALERDGAGSDKIFFWIPFVRMQDLSTTIKYYNEEMRKICKEEDVDFVGAVLETEFDDSCFYDYIHFSEKGNKRFAQILADYIKSGGSE